MRKVQLSFIFLLLVLLSACNTWEHNVFQTLSTSKAAIETAISEYNSKQIPNTPQNKQIIDTAKEAHNAAVQAFQTYYLAKTAVGVTGNVAAQQTAVNQALVSLNQAVVQIKTLIQRVK